MRALVTKGQLISVDTDRGEIQLTDGAEGEAITLNIGPDTRLPISTNWDTLIGEDVEAIVIDGKIKKLLLA